MISDLVSLEPLSPVARRELLDLVTRLQNHVSGDFVTVTPLAEMFFSTAGSWTVNTNLALLAYTKVGRSLVLDFRAQLTSVVTTTPAELRIKLPSGFINVSAKSMPFAFTDNGVAGTGIARTAVGTNYVSLLRNLLGIVWTLSTNNTTVEGQLILEVKP